MAGTSDLESLRVNLELNLRQFEAALARANKQTISGMRKVEKEIQASGSRVEKSLTAAGSALAGFGKGLVIGGIFAAVAGLEQLIAGSISSAAAIGDLSDKLGITSDKLQELEFGAVQANMSFDELETSLLKFSKALGQARNGQGDLLKTLEANGFDKAKIKAMSYSEALDTVANLVKNAATEQDALLIITQAFGKGGDEMLEFLRGGSEGLKKFADDAHNAGAIIEEDLVKGAQRFDDAWSTSLLHIKKGIADFVLEGVSAIEKLWNLLDHMPTGMMQTMRFFKTGNALPEAGTTPLSALTQSGAGKGDRSTKIFDPEVAAALTEKTKELAREKKKAADAIQKVIDALELEGITLGKSNVQQEVATALSKADVDAKSKQGKEIQSLVEKNEMHKASLESVAFAAEQSAQRQEDFAQSLTDLADQGVSAFEQWAIEGDKLSDVIGNLAKSLLDAAVKAALFGSGPFAGLFGSSQGGGFFANLFSSPKLYAKGGTIGAGKWGIAGEAGPELIQGPGKVIPFSKMGGSGAGSMKVTVINQTPARVETQRDSSGNPLIFIRQAVSEAISGGFADSALQNRHGLMPHKARR